MLYGTYTVLYTCLIVERWMKRIANTAGVGTIVRYKQDQRRQIHNPDETVFSELQFADDRALLVTMRAGAEETLHMYIEVVGEMGLIVSILNKKQLVTGRETTD